MREPDARTVAVAKMIAFWHGARITIVRSSDRGGAMTVAAQHGYGKYGDAPERYAKDYWEYYVHAAEAVIHYMEPDYVG